VTADDLAQISQHLLRPVRVQVANLVARATVQLVDDSGQMQTLQLGDVAGGPYGDCEHLQPYGFSSVPLAGADTACAIFPNGDRGHPLVVAVADRRSRPTGGAAGDVTVYNAAGARITLLATGDIDIHPAPGGKVLVHDGGTATAVATKQDLAILRAALSTAAITLGVGGAATIGPAADVLVAALVPTPSPPTWPIGTKVLEGE
jgi:phage baseplate assembly protein V